MGCKPNRAGIRSAQMRTTALAAASGSPASTEVEVPLGAAGGKRGQAALVDPVGRLHDAAPLPLTENPLQTKEGYNSGLKNVPQELAGPNGGQLVRISGEQHRGVARHGL